MTRQAEDRKLPVLGLIASTILVLVGCSADVSHDPGLIAVPGFSGDDGRLQRPWSFVHHATLGSYDLRIDGDVLSIERTGPEPSSTLAQSLPREVLDKAAGRTLIFAADLKARLEEDTWGPPLSPTGMVVRIQSPPAGGSSHMDARLGGMGRQQTERLDLSSSIQMEEWQRYELEFDVPEDVEQLTVSFAMTAGGTLEIRNPSLTVVDR
ncbi:hypothetical protein IC757_10800 [Wenzhouxiangella sp. AB-CW3]|uniref:hypothetical protein n=1 Tax=Wenzhouxiangella sp. AB-CW3 TaxID=2771012 RepID=UPI00168AF711|nr:hypothetical protein [Wenzhouxiangella sp. AB-CW3]QOC21532.1 hypothetical protein IC757_10800 [Wenzhouxiangella sp. AB-CW3]